MNEINFDNVDWNTVSNEPTDVVEDIDLGAEDLTNTVKPVTLDQAFKVNPSQHAQNVKIQREAGIPIEAVESDPTSVSTDLKLKKINFDEMSKRAPGTSGFLTDYNNAVIAQDDIDVMQVVEDTLRSIPAGFVEGGGMAVEGAGRFIEAGGRMVGRGLDFLTPDAVSQSIPDALKEFNELIAPANLIKRQGALLKTQAEDIADVPAERENIATDIAGGVGQVAGQIALSLLNPQAAVGAMFMQGVDQQGERQEASGTEGQSNTSDLALFAGGGVTAVSEKIGLDALLNRVPPAIKNKVLRQITDISLAGGIEAVQEVVEGIAQGVLEQITTNPDAEIFEGLDREAIAAGGTGAIVRGIVNALTPGRVRTVEEQQVAEQTQTQFNAITLEKLNNNIAGMKMKQYDTETLKKFMEAADNEEGTTVFVDAVQASLYLNTKTPEQIKQDKGLQRLQDQVNSAAALGSDVEIPVADFAVDFAGTEHFDNLKEHMSLNADVMSPFRAEQSKEETRNYVQSLMAEADESVSQYIESQEIYETVKQQLVDSGQVNAQNAGVMAQVVPAWATVYAKKNGISVKEAYERSGLQIEGPQTGERARLEGELALLNQSELFYRGQPVNKPLRLNEDGLLWITPDADYAADPHYGGKTGAEVIELSANVDNVFDYNNKEHAEFLRSFKKPLFRSAAKGNFRALKDKEVVNALKQKGFDGFKAIEPEGQPSVALFNLPVDSQSSSLNQPEVQQMLDMDENAFIQAVNPEGKVIADDDIVKLNIGDLDLPEATTPVSSFEADGQTINVVSDTDGNMYAVSDDGVLGMVGPAEDNETMIDLVAESKGKGVGKELAKAYMRQNPMAPAGGFTKAGEATYRAAFRELKAERDSLLKQSQVLPDRFAIIGAVKGRTPVENLIKTASGLAGKVEGVYTVDNISEFSEDNRTAINSIENVSVIHSSRPDKMATVWDESGKVYRVINGKVSEVSTEQDPNSDLSPSQGLTLNILSNVFRDARNTDPKEIEAQRIREIRTTETRRRQERLKSIPKMPPDFDQALQQLADWAENLEEFKKALNPDMFDISDRNLTRLGRATMSLDPEFEVAGDGDTVTIYRALPEGEEIEAGDWVSFDEVYAAGHETNVGEEGGTTISMEVPSDEVYTPGADQNEWVYIPKDTWGDITSIDELWQSLTDGSKPNTYPEVEGGQLFAQSEVGQVDQTETEEFKKWSDNGEVVEPEDINDYEFKADTPVVLKVFHGTTHNFSVFEAERGNLEGQFGAVNYFTSSEQDATDNYAGEGPDLTNRIQQRAEQLQNELEDDPDSFGLDEDVDFEEEALRIARDELSGGEDQVMELYVKVTNPFVIGENAEWIEFTNDDEVQELAIEEVASNNDISVEEVNENIDDYEDEINDARWAVQEDMEHPLIEAIQTVSDRYDVDASELASQVYDLGNAARPEDVEQFLRSSDDYMYAEDPDTGTLIQSHLIGEVIREMGYDAIILKNAEGRFSTMNMEPDTTHVHIFDSGKTNIKSVENQGTFDPTNPDIFMQSATEEDVNQFSKELEKDLGLKTLFMFKDRTGDLKLETIIVDENERSAGKGSEAMNRIVEFADRNNMRVVLTPAVQDDFQGTTSRKRLVGFYKRFGFVENKGRNKDFTVNADAMYREPSLSQESQTKDGTRGYYDPANSMIRLTEAADLSTFLHEFAHFMYEMELKADGETMQSIHNWFKRNADDVAKEAGEYAPNTTIIPKHVIAYLDEGTAGDAERDNAIRRAVHEQFARGFETYLMEGKAPSVELRNAFRTFARWLTQIYKAIRGQLNVNLDDEMRQVFDAMLATDEQIEMAEARLKFQPLLNTEEMSEEDRIKYEKQQEKVKDKQAETLRDKLIAEITRTTQKWWNDEKSDMIDEELAVLKDEKVYRAREVLSSSELKLDHATVKEMSGFQRTDKRGRTSTVIPTELRGMTAKGQQGVHPDEAAAILGYSSGSEMIQDLLTAEPIGQVAEQKAEARMFEKYGDIMNDGTIQKEADEAVQNEERGKLILQELKELRRLNNQPMLERSMMKQVAEQTIAALPYNKIFPGKYRKAEIKAAQEAAAAYATGDNSTAANAKARQAMNYYLAMEATAAKNEIDKISSNMGRYNKTKVREEIMKVNGGFMEQIDKILARFEFRKSKSIKSVDAKNQDINSWMLERTEREGDALVLTNAVLNELYQTHWKKVPYSELKGIYDSVRNMEHVARYSNKINKLGEKVEFKKLVNDWTDHMNAVQPDRFKSQRTGDTEGRNWGRWAMAQMTKIPFMASWLDGNERAGMSHDILVQPFTDAYDAELKLWNEAGKPVMDLIENRSKADIKRHNTKIFIPEIKTAEHDGNLYGHQILAVALNVGNESNLRKMLLGEGWADPDDDTSININNPQLQAVLSKMTQSDWELVQKIWDQMEILYPMLAEVHRKTTGLVPPKIDAIPVPTQYGTFNGGYYPVKYSPNRSLQALENEDKLNAQTESMFGGTMSIQASVNASATNERTGYYGPIKLSLDVVPNHFQETIHYITHHDAVRQVNKLIRNDKVAQTIIDKLGQEEYNQLKPWLNDIAKDGREAPLKTFWGSMLQRLRFGVTLGAMGFKASTGIIQISGLSNTVAEVGIGPVMQSARSILGSPATIKSAWDFAVENSKVMNHRAQTMDREIKNAMKRIEGKRGVLAATQEMSMKHIALIQTYMVDLPSWHAAYIKSMNEFGDEQRAYRYADWVVENVQGSGVTKDMAQIMRGQSEEARMFTMFMTFFSSLWNLERDLVKGAKSGKYSVTSVGAKAMFLFSIPVLFEMLMRGEFGGDDEPEEQLQTMLTKTAMFPLQSVPFVRDVVNAVGGDYGYNITPLQALLEQGTQTIPKIVTSGFTDDEITKGQAKGASKFAGAALGIPGTGQAWATGEHLYDVIEEGEDFTVHQLLFGPKKD